MEGGEGEQEVDEAGGGVCVCVLGGVHSVLFLIDQQLLPSVRREKRKREGCAA